MKRRTAFVTLIAAVCLSADTLTACGDKFITIGFGPQRRAAYAAIHPASILIIVPPKSVKVAAVRDHDLLDALKSAGHRPRTIQLPADVERLLATESYDIVLVERADVDRVLASYGGKPRPSVICVIEDPSPAALEVAQRELPFVLKTPQPRIAVLSMLDEVMKARIESTRADRR